VDAAVEAAFRTMEPIEPGVRACLAVGSHGGATADGQRVVLA